MKIAFSDMQKMNEAQMDTICEGLSRVVISGKYILGEELSAFEREFAAYCGTSHCLGVANGTDALLLSLKVLGFEKGSEVILASNSYIATALAVVHNNLIPVLVEPNPVTFNIDPAGIEEKITPSTRAILVTHMYGNMCEMEEIEKLASKHNLQIIEDCSHAHGAVLNHCKAGSFGRVAAFSFYPTKNHAAMGDAGAIVTSDGGLAAKLKQLRNYGFETKNFSSLKGFNSRLDEMQAAVLRIKLRHLDAYNHERKSIASKYLRGINNTKVVLPQNSSSHVWHLFVVMLRERDALAAFLNEQGIETAIHYPLPFFRQASFSELHHLSMPIAASMSRQVLSIPLHPGLAAAEIDHIIQSINRF